MSTMVVCAQVVWVKPDMSGTDRFIAIALTMAVALGYLIGCCCCFGCLLVSYTHPRQPHSQVIAERFLQLKCGSASLQLFNDCRHLKCKEANPVAVCKDCESQLVNGRRVTCWLLTHPVAAQPIWVCRQLPILICWPSRCSADGFVMTFPPMLRPTFLM